MADQKISQLNNIAGANVAADDEFVIVDTDANETKAIRADNIRAAVGLATTDSPTFAGLTVDTNTLYVDAASNEVGIGTTSPSAKLDVVGNAEINGTLTTTGNVTIDSAGSADIILDKGASGNLATISSRTGGSQRWGLILGNALAESSTSTGSDFLLRRSSNTGAYIDDPISIPRSNGNVLVTNNLGIGTTSPSAKLDVVGNAEINGALTTTGNVAIANALTTNGSITVDAPSNAGINIDKNASGNVSVLNGLTGGSTRWQVVVGDSTAESGGNAGSDFQIFGYTDAGAYLNTPLTITRSTGNVTIPNNLGIGTTSPSEKLDVVGNAEINGNTICTGYVKTQATTVASLTAAATAGAGARSFVTDATATTFASVVAGGGANAVPVYSDGTDWRIG